MAPRSSGEAHLAGGTVSDAPPETREIASSKTPRDDNTLVCQPTRHHRTQPPASFVITHFTTTTACSPRHIPLLTRQ